ncbi:MAG: NHL repeat-containing protein [Candidatus Eremiobacteraeota bacterium]|nr:NHL repeat-containing protein [Candidatus Eremiobacteraeota bacterium]
MKRILALLVCSFIVTACSQSSTSPVTAPTQQLLVVNSNGNSIAFFTVSGSAAVLGTTISGSNTQLVNPTGVGFSSGRIFVANNLANTVTVYPAGASGNAPPSTTIAGSNTGLDHPTDIDVDSAGRVYVGNSGSTIGNSVRIFAPGASGNATPVASIFGPSTALAHPVSVAHDAAGNIYVANVGNNSLTIYRSSDVFSSPTGDVAPFATLAGALTGLSGPSGIALDTSGNVYVTNGAANSITVYAPNPSGNQAPSATIAGASTAIDLPGDIEIVGGYMYVANAGSNDLLVFPLTASGDVAPSAVVTGPELDFPNGLALE